MTPTAEPVKAIRSKLSLWRDRPCPAFTPGVLLCLVIAVVPEFNSVPAQTYTITGLGTLTGTNQFTDPSRRISPGEFIAR